MGRRGKSFLPFFSLSMNLLMNMVQKIQLCVGFKMVLGGFFMLTIFVSMQCQSSSFKSMKC
jgi:hypothetical protein